MKFRYCNLIKGSEQAKCLSCIKSLRRKDQSNTGLIRHLKSKNPTLFEQFEKSKLNNERSKQKNQIMLENSMLKQNKILCTEPLRGSHTGSNILMLFVELWMVMESAANQFILF